MANNIDERIVELQFDNKQFESGVKDTIKSLDDLKKGLKLEDVTNGFVELDKAAGKVSLNPLQNGVERLSEKFSALEIIAISALNRITNQAMATGERLIKSFTLDPIMNGWNQYESKVASVQKIMNSQVGLSMDTVQASLDKIEWFTNETSYHFDAMVSTLGSFAAAGIPLQQAEKTIIGLANAAAISGVNANDASHAFLGFQRAIGSGYLSLGLWNSYLKTAGFQSQAFINGCIKAAAELNVLKEGVNGVYETAKGTQVTLETFGETLSEKWLNKDVINKMAENFSVATDQLYEIMNPEVGDAPYAAVTSAIKDLRGELDEYSLAAFEAGQETKTWGDTVEYVRGSVAQTWSKTWELIFGNYEEATVFFSTIVEEMYEMFVAAGDARNEFLTEWKDLGGRNTFISGMINSVRILNQVISNVREAIARVIPPVAVESAVAFTAAFERATVAIAEAMGIDDISDTLKQSIDEVTEGLNDTAEAGEGVAGTMKTIAEMANLVIRGDYGNGAARREALENLGYSYEMVQNKVNELLGCSFRYEVQAENEAKAANKVAEGATSVANSLMEQRDVVISVGGVMNNLASTFQGVVAVAEIFAYAIGSVARVAARVFKYVFKLGEGFLGITGSIGDLIVSIKDFIINNDILFLGLSKIADLIELVLTPVINIFTGLMDSLSNRTNPLLGFIDTLTAGISSIAEINFADEFDKVFKSVSESIMQFGGYIETGIASVIKFISESTIFQNVLTGLSTAFTVVSESVKWFFGNLRSVPSMVLDNITSFYNNTVKWIKSVDFPELNLNFDTFVNTIKEFGRNNVITPVITAFTFVSEKVKEFGTFLVNTATGIAKFVKENNVLENALKGLLLVVMAVPLGIMKIWDAVKGTPIAIFNSVKDFFTQIGQRLKDLKLPEFKIQFDQLWNTIKNGVNNTVLPGLSNGLKDVSKTLSDFIVGAVQGAAEFAKFVKQNDLLGKAMKFVPPIIDKLQTSIRGMWDSLKSTVPNIIQSIKDAFGVFKGWFDTYKLGSLKWSFDDFWRSFLPTDNILVKLNDFKRDGISGLFHGIGIFKNVGREMKAYYEAVVSMAQDYAKDNKFIQYLVNAFKNIKTKLADLFGYVKKAVIPVMEKIKEAAQPVIDKVSQFYQKIKEIDYNKVMQFIAVVGSLVVLFKLLKAVGNITNFLSGIGDLASGLSNLTASVKIKAIGSFVLDLGIVMGVLAGILYLLSKLSWDEIIRGAAGLLTCGIILGGCMITFSKIARYDTHAILSAIGAMLGIAVALGVVVAAMYYLKDFDDMEYLKSLAKIAGILLVLVISMRVISAAMKNKTIDITSMGGLFIFVMTMSKLLSLLREVSDMDLPTILKSVTLLLGVATTLVIVAGSVNGLKFSNTFSLVGMVGALWLFVQLVKGLAKEDYSKICEGLLKMVPVFIAIRVLAKAGGAAGKGGLGVAAMILSLAIGMKLIASAVKELGRIPWQELVTGLGAAVTILAVLGFAIKTLTASSGAVGFFKYAGGGYAKTILAFSVALLAAAEAINILSNIENPGKALIAAIALSGVIVALGAALRLASRYTGGSALQIGLMIAAIVAITASLAVLQMLDVEKIKKVALALGVVIGALGLALMGITAVPWYQIILQVGLMAATIVLIATELRSLAALDPKSLTAASNAMAELIVSFGVVCGALALLPIDPIKLAGAGAGIGLAIAALEALVVGLTELMARFAGHGDVDAGLEKMVNIFTKVGEMFGSLAGGALAGYADKLDGVGEKLSAFAEGAKGFAEIMGNGKWSKMSTNVSDLVRCMKEINSEPPKLENFTKYSSAMYYLGNGITNLMAALKDANFDFTRFSQLATALPQIIDIVKNPVNVNDKYWDTFSTTLEKLGNALVAFSDAVKGDAINLTGITNASSAITKIVGVAEKIKDLGQFDGFDKLIGGVDANGESSLTRLAKGLKSFSEAIGDGVEEGSVDIYRLQDMFEAVRRLAVAASKIPENKGKMDIQGNILGTAFNFQNADNFSWDTLSTGLAELATAMVNFSTTAEGISDTGLDNGLNAVSRFATMAQQLPPSFKSDLMKFLFEDDNTLGGFATAIESLGGALKNFHDQLKDLTAEALDPSFQMIDKILSLPQKFIDAGITSDDGGVAISLSTWGDNLVNFAEKFVEAVNILNEAAVSLNTPEDEGSSLAESFGSLFQGFFDFFNEDNLTRIQEIGTQISMYLAAGVNSDSSYAEEAAMLWISALTTAMASADNVTNMTNSGKEIAKKYIDGFKSEESKNNAKAAAEVLCRAMYSKFHEPSMIQLFIDSGKHLVDGLIQGIESKRGEVEAAARELGRAANEAFESEEHIQSPSKVWREYGVFLGLGAAGGLYDSIPDVVSAASFLARRLNESFEGESIAPTITPVVDLGNAAVSASRINNMFDANRAAALSASMNINSQVTQMDDLVDMTAKILGSIQNGSDLYLDDSILAGRINRRLGVL